MKSKLILVGALLMVPVGFFGLVYHQWFAWGISPQALVVMFVRQSQHGYDSLGAAGIEDLTVALRHKIAPAGDRAKRDFFKAWTSSTNAAINARPRRFSRRLGGKTRTYPASFTRAAKLETQKGMRNSRKTCQRSSAIVPWEDDRVLITRATPMMTLRPIEVSQSRGRASKWFATLTTYQMA